MNLGATYSAASNHESAIQTYKMLIDLNQDQAKAYNNSGLVYTDVGDVKSARICFEKSIAINASLFEAHNNLALITKYNEQSNHLHILRKIDSSKFGDAKDNYHIKFALAKAMEDTRDFASVFVKYTEANALKRRTIDYDIAIDKSIFERVYQAQTNLDKFSRGQMTLHDPGTIPIFIIGMPRSGTTLVEQIISNHREIKACGELNTLGLLCAELLTKPNEYNETDLLEIRAKYLSNISKLSDGSRYITDKMPQNFLLVPFIILALPEAKIVHIRSNPAATCWSNFKQNFQNNSLNYSYDINDIVTYYHLYSKLMDHWKNVFEDRIVQLDYENLTNDSNQTITELLKGLQLEWDENCLFPENNPRSVRTASQLQVRQPIYRLSSKNWENYKPYLNGAFDTLL